MRSKRNTLRANIEGTIDVASRHRPRLAELADRIAQVFTPIVLVVAASSWIGWWWQSGSLSHATSIALAVLVVACPCAIGLATPAAVAVALGRAAREGLVVKDARRFEELSRVRVVALDKTGTLTVESRSSRGSSTGSIDAREALRLAASLEAHVEHPLARSIFLGAMAEGIEVAPADDVTVQPGEGVSGKVGDRELAVGRRDVVELALEPRTRAQIEAARSRGASTADADRRGQRAHRDFHHRRTRSALAPASLAALASAGLRLVVLSGDHVSAVRSVSAHVGVSDARGGLSPRRSSRQWQAPQRARRDRDGR